MPISSRRNSEAKLKQLSDEINNQTFTYQEVQKLVLDSSRHITMTLNESEKENVELKMALEDKSNMIESLLLEVEILHRANKDLKIERQALRETNVTVSNQRDMAIRDCVRNTPLTFMAPRACITPNTGVITSGLLNQPVVDDGPSFHDEYSRNVF